jgi:D-3-phosphoglycerate dehydrogenase / 2-oxoglutarate reductase
MTTDLIFVALSSFAERDSSPLRRLEQSGWPFRVHSSGKRITTSELMSEARDASVIIAGVESYNSKTLDALPALRCIARCGVGTDNVDLRAAREREIAVLNTPNIPTQAVAELTLAMFLTLSRNLRRQSNLMTERRWDRLEAHLLAGRTVGLIGLGRIGRRVAELCRAFGTTVLANDPVVDDGYLHRQGVTMTSLEELLASSDIVSLHASTSAKRPTVIGHDQFAIMKPGAILVNVARGGMVDEAALQAALESGRLAGAGLDVFSEEPYSGPLCAFDQVVLTPHSATLTVETRAAMESECVDKSLRFLRGALSDSERVV